MRGAAYSFASRGCMPESSSVRRSASAKARSTIFIEKSFSFPQKAGHRSPAAPEAPQVGADGLERYPGSSVGNMDRDHARAPPAQGGEQRTEPALLQRFEAAAAGVGVRERERRAQAVEHDKMAAVFRRAPREPFRPPRQGAPHGS